VVIFTPLPLYSRGKSPRYPLDRRLGRLQSRSGQRGEEKILNRLDRPVRSQSLYRLRYPGSSASIEWLLSKWQHNTLPCFVCVSLARAQSYYRPSGLLSKHVNTAVSFHIAGVTARSVSGAWKRFWATYCLNLSHECDWGEDAIRLYGNFLFIFPVVRIGLIIPRSSSDGTILVWAVCSPFPVQLSYEARRSSPSATVLELSDHLPACLFIYNLAAFSNHSLRPLRQSEHVPPKRWYPPTTYMGS
jgi:hypothetical protein